jgi:hypothetical protein
MSYPLHERRNTITDRVKCSVCSKRGKGVGLSYILDPVNWQVSDRRLLCTKCRNKKGYSLVHSPQGVRT